MTKGQISDLLDRIDLSHDANRLLEERKRLLEALKAEDGRQDTSGALFESLDAIAFAEKDAEDAAEPP